jgi:hypothetical protein
MPNTRVPAAAGGLPNRRLFLAAGSAGAIFGAVSAATNKSLAATESLSDLLALIDAHRTAKAAHESQLDKSDEAQKIYRAWALNNWRFSPVLRFGEVKLIDDNLEECRQHFHACLNHQKRHELDRMARFFGDQSVERFDLALDAAVVEKMTLIEAKFAEQAAKMEACGLTQAIHDEEMTSEAQNQALMAICRYQCSSIRESGVKEEYLSTISDEWDYEHIKACLHSVGSAKGDQS